MDYVSAGILRRNDQILVCQRPENCAFGLQWEFPGGKREVGESAEECLIRELKEELDLELNPEKIHPFYILTRPDTGLHMDFLIVDTDNYQPRMLEHNGMQWVRKDELDKFDFCINDKLMLEQINIDDLFA